MAEEELLSFRGDSSAMPLPPEPTMLRNDPPELMEAISQLRKVLALELPLGLTTEYLARLQNAIEVAERAVRTERWAREGREFQGE